MQLSRNCSRLKEIKETWRPDAMHDPQVDFREEKVQLQDITGTIVEIWRRAVIILNSTILPLIS